MCDCAEERARREALARNRQSGQAGASSDDPDSGVRWYSVLGGTLLMALGLMAVAVKTGLAKPLLIMLGMYEEKPNACGVRIKKGKRKWPSEDKGPE